VADHLVGENVSVVTGVEYHRRAGVVSNEAVGVFMSGYNLGVVCVWRKGKPARDEERKLISNHVAFKRSPHVPPLTVHTKGGAISTLICSELLEVERRAALMGRVDLLLVPSWNTDTATFDHTIQTTANDVHCYVAIANNAMYSDCRVHCPSDERYKRDVCRLICRGQDETISAHLDFDPLRNFQRRSADPTADPKGFKPVPPGFQFKR
jgi:predicted amidohydrolase